MLKTRSFVGLLTVIVLLQYYGGVGAGKGHRDRRQTLSTPPFTQDQIRSIVDRHNELRKQVEPPASNMQHMFWHEELAGMAQSWAEECIWEHGQPDVTDPEYPTIGQNMKQGAGLEAMRAIDQWFDEREFYDLTSSSCEANKICGHYTQVAWARSKHVGCGVAECTDNGGTYNMVVCNYGPPGNYRNAAPYIEGVGCSECPSPSWCYQGLCMPGCAEHDMHSSECECRIKCEHCGIRDKDSCTCTCTQGFTGEYCEKNCDNHNRLCGAGWYRHWCNDDHPKVPVNCPLMCGLCQQLPEGTDEPICCDGKTCQNGGDLDAATCSCECTKDYTGDLCENAVTTPVMVKSTEKPAEEEDVVVAGKTTGKTEDSAKSTVTAKSGKAASSSSIVNSSVMDMVASILLAIVYLAL